MNALLANLDTILLYVFAFCALVGAVLMIVLRQPMRVALALISTMVFLGGIYGLLGVHFIAAFQVLIYVGAVMVFMVYVIMLLDARDPAYTRRFSRMLVPGVIGMGLLLAALGVGLSDRGLPTLAAPAPAGKGSFGLQQFAEAFLSEYWLHFELTSVLLVAAVVAAMAVIKVSRRGDRG
jgi:NADH-quinone oxidoreductase subunit J